MSDYFDLSRINELKDLMGSEVGPIVASMLVSMTGAIEEVEAALAAGELDRATRAAHAARNDALMLGAGPLQRALSDLEAATRRLDEAQARVALERLREIWPATRAGLAAASAN
jgi:HPt (histidine-containing phosphotransfer) domain-containing protein